MPNHDSNSELYFSIRETMPRKDIPAFEAMAMRRTHVLDTAAGAVMRLGMVVNDGWVQSRAPYEQWQNPAAQADPAVEAPVMGRNAPDVQDPRNAYSAATPQQVENVYPEVAEEGYDRQTHLTEARSQLDRILSQN